MVTKLSEKFSILTKDISDILPTYQNNEEKFNTLINELYSMPYGAERFVKRTDAENIFNELCLNIDNSDEGLVAKASHLFYKIFIHQNLQLDDEMKMKYISWHLKCLKKCSKVIFPDLIHNLEGLLHSYPHLGTMFLEDITGEKSVIISVLNHSSMNESTNAYSPHVVLDALKCISSVLSENENSFEIKDDTFNLIISLLLKGKTTRDEATFCRVAITALKVLSQLCLKSQQINIPLSNLIGIAHYYVLYGIAEQSDRPGKIVPSQQALATEPVSQKSKGGKKQRLRRKKINAFEHIKKEIPVSDSSLSKDISSFENNAAYMSVSENYLEPQQPENNWMGTSDSDVSDVESKREAKLITLKSRVRQSASNLLLALVKVTEKRVMFGYWWAFFPDSYLKYDNTLAYCILRDPIVSSRTNALNVMLALVSGSRSYLFQAEFGMKNNASFIPFSVTLGYMVTSLHKILITVLESERSHMVITACLKCCAALVQATPYHKMKDSVLRELVNSCSKFLMNKDIKLQVAALIVLGCVISIDPKTDEVLKCIENECTQPLQCEKQINCTDYEEDYSEEETELNVFEETKANSSSDRYFKSWILDICFQNLGCAFINRNIEHQKPSSIPVIMESLQVLSAIGFHYFEQLLHPHLNSVADVLCQMLTHEYQDVVYQSAKTVSVLGDAMLKSERNETALSTNDYMYFWKKVLGPLSSILQHHDNPFAKSAVCDCIANIGESCFEKLERGSQMLWCALVVGSCGDAEGVVRAAAVRALAIIVMYRPLRQDIHFVSDCGENILRALSETVSVVRVKAAWALGNLSEALVLNLEDPEADLLDENLLLRLIEVGIKCTDDNDKIRMSATRALGNLLRLVKIDLLTTNTASKALCEKAIDKLIDCACKVTNMKVRWNSCYAIGNMMRNECLFTGLSSWQSRAFASLCKLCCECKNLKVRITAATAIRAPSTRAFYGRHYASVWTAVLAALENATDVDDFTEYNHRDNLVEQLCVTLAHLCCLLSPTELGDIADPLTFHYECAKTCITRLYSRLTPESASSQALLRAAEHTTLITPDTRAHSQLLAMLQELFIWDV